ncbi:hypothetical protein NKH77_25700 [Streptomyces sp. M19]
MSRAQSVTDVPDTDATREAHVALRASAVVAGRTDASDAGLRLAIVQFRCALADQIMINAEQRQALDAITREST